MNYSAYSGPWIIRELPLRDMLHEPIKRQMVNNRLYCRQFDLKANPDANTCMRKLSTTVFKACSLVG